MSDDHTQINLERFNDKASDWDEDPRRVKTSLDIARAIGTAIPLSKEMQLMEYGCGTGNLSLALAPSVGNILAVDLSPGMIDVLAKKLNEKDAPKNIKPLQWDLLQIHPEDRNRFDGIITSLTLHHIENPLALLTRFRDLLAPEGFVAIADLCIEQGKYFHHDNAGVAHDGFNEASISAVLQEAGFAPPNYSEPVAIEKVDPEGDLRRFGVFLAVARTA